MANPLSGLETIQAVREKQNKTLLAFSTGKDAIAAWLAIREHFDEVIPYYLYLIPDLEFVEESLSYYEKFFGVKIARLPHPTLHRWLNELIHQPPQNCLCIEQARLPDFDYIHIQQAMVQMHKLPSETLVADGVRAADSPMRRVAMLKHGTISYNQLKYHPIWDWKKRDLIDCFNKHKIKLSIDYKLFGRSFDGLDLRFLMPLKKHLPNDYKKILEWFPLAELEIFRYERSLNA
ncbi:phosphoadenosine phosphosulfate reductase [Gilliamella sp. Nev6-6]|uniref:phosphoadenosine phosphosulfate reductase n=1 Tax=Gilliamella sp. Nev6-6 TaxID=3120252 RepID=UPI00080F408E|nr:phosphoadenosine phosphosulfate reductase [Gilliamella apicola]OCG77375.1 phosphoadenosine phosphosulfate reductase [Gilliamella apicola]